MTIVRREVQKGTARRVHPTGRVKRTTPLVRRALQLAQNLKFTPAVTAWVLTSRSLSLPPVL